MTSSSSAQRRWGAWIGILVAVGTALAALGVWATRRWALQRAREGLLVDRSVTVERPVEDVFAAWSHYPNLARIMRHVERVEDLGNGRTRWTARVPKTGQLLHWNAETVERRENERIFWRSLPGSDVEQVGEVTFRRLGDGARTRVHLRLSYQPPGGPIAKELMWFFSSIPEQVVEEDLRQFERALENGGIPSAPIEEAAEPRG